MFVQWIRKTAPDLPGHIKNHGLVCMPKGYHKLIGKHYFDEGKNPTWELNDGSRISGVKVQQASAPDTTAIPWLLLKATRSGGSGSLKQVQFIQRIRTNGGKAPAVANRQKMGQPIEVPYAAEYLFYSDK